VRRLHSSSITLLTRGNGLCRSDPKWPQA